MAMRLRKRAATLKQRKRIVTLGKKIKIERQQNLKNQIQQNKVERQG